MISFILSPCLLLLFIVHPVFRFTHFALGLATAVGATLAEPRLGRADTAADIAQGSFCSLLLIKFEIGELITLAAMASEETPCMRGIRLETGAVVGRFEGHAVVGSANVATQDDVEEDAIDAIEKAFSIAELPSDETSV